jgi:hypothetical protein
MQRGRLFFLRQGINKILGNKKPLIFSNIGGCEKSDGLLRGPSLVIVSDPVNCHHGKNNAGNYACNNRNEMINEGRRGSFGVGEIDSPQSKSYDRSDDECPVFPASLRSYVFVPLFRELHRENLHWCFEIYYYFATEAYNPFLKIFSR